MPAINCPIEHCDYTTPDVDAVIAAALITTHAIVHSAMANNPPPVKVEKVKRPTKPSPGTSEDLSYFVSKLNDYVGANKVSSKVKSRKTFTVECASKSLHPAWNISENQAKQLTSKVQVSIRNKLLECVNKSLKSNYPRLSPHFCAGCLETVVKIYPELQRKRKREKKASSTITSPVGASEQCELTYLEPIPQPEDESCIVAISTSEKDTELDTALTSICGPSNLQHSGPTTSRPIHPVPPHKYPNWKHHVGKIKAEYIHDTMVRRKCRNERRKTLCVKGHELASRCGGEVFIQYRDENNKCWTYCSSEGLWEKYATEGIKQTWHPSEILMDRHGKCPNKLGFPKPTKTETVTEDSNCIQFVFAEDTAEDTEDSS